MSINKNKNSGKDIWETIKLVTATVLIIAVLGTAVSFMTVPIVVETQAKEELWTGTATVKVLFSGSMYPDIKDVSDNPSLGGIEIKTEENKVVITNLNKDFIAISGTAAITEIVAPGKTISMSPSKEIFVSFPDPRIIRGGPPDTYYFDFRTLY